MNNQSLFHRTYDTYDGIVIIIILKRLFVQYGNNSVGDHTFKNVNKTVKGHMHLFVCRDLKNSLYGAAKKQSKLYEPGRGAQESAHVSFFITRDFRK